MERASVLVIGSLNADLVTRVERLPAPGETVLGSSFAVHAGGKGANQAVAAARMGAAVRMVGCIGDDAFGLRLCGELRRAGVDARAVRKATAEPTGTAQILVDAAGRNQIAVAPGANGALTPAEATAPEVWDGITLVLMQLEVPMAVNEAAIDAAAVRGVPVLLNAAPARTLAPEALARVGWLVVNETEAERLTGETIGGAAEAVSAVSGLASSGVSGIVVTLGAAGAVLIAGDRVVRRRARSVGVVDTVAAGDAFVGAFAAGLVQRRPVEECLERAVVAGTLACTRAGAIPSLPMAEEVESLLGGGD